jgi:hypothetical protein
MKVYAHAQSHTYVTLSMDANETDRLQGRRTGPKADLRVNYRYFGSTLTPTYTCYTDEFTDAHLLHNPEMYSPSASPGTDALNNYNSNGSGCQVSKIGFTFISVNLIARLQECTLLDKIPDIAPEGTTYHRPFLTELSLPSLFTSNLHPIKTLYTD